MKEEFDISDHFSEKYVAFIDVLGFKDLIYSGNRELRNSKLNEYYTLIFEATESIEKQEELKVIAISDSIIIIADNTDFSFHILLNAVQSLQSYLIHQNIWLRGGISFGEVAFVKEKNLVVGEGYIKAFLLEHQAVFPRVIIDPLIVSINQQTLKEFIKLQNYDPINNEEKPLKLIHEYTEEKYRMTESDAIFIDYASRVVFECSSMDGNVEMNKIYTFIKNNLYSGQTHYKKYMWVKKYFTEVINDEVRRKNPLLKGSFYDYWLDKFLQL